MSKPLPIARLIFLQLLNRVTNLTNLYLIMRKIIFLLLALFAGTIMNAQYSSIAIVGNGVGGWPTGAAGEIDARQMTSTDGIHWSIENLVTSAGAVKFRAANSWTTNWGGPASAFPSGTAVANGGNITVQPGVYNLTFNSTTLAYQFTISNLYPVISLVGTGVNNADVDLGTTDGIHYTGNGIAINGGIRLRKDHADVNTWTLPAFPSGTATANGTEMLNIPNGIYNITFNLTTLEYGFRYPSVAIVGSGTAQGWPADPQVDAHVFATTDGIHYVINSITLSNAAVKFRQENSWTVQWGGDGGFPTGRGFQSGIDLEIPAGTFSITLNRNTGAYSFAKPLGTSTPPNCTLIPIVSAAASSGNGTLAVDGDSATQWQSESANPQSITLDLGTTTALSAVAVTWNTYSAKDYVLSGSADGLAWTVISEQNDKEYGARTDVIENVNAQYRWLKVDATAANTQFGYAIYEINICGTPIVPGTEKHILFIGNSYTYYNSMPTLVEYVAASMGDELVAASSTVGGTSLEEHFVNTGTLGKLQQGQWDFVVLQDNSTRPALQDSYVADHVAPFAAQLADLARDNSPCADLFFYQTWGRKNGDATNCPAVPEVCTYEGMDDRLQLRYGQLAQDNDAAVSPVAAVRRQIRLQHPEIELYVADESHPTLAGSYVSAVTFYTVLYRKDPTLITYNSTLSATVADQIKAIVKSVAFDHLATWNVGAYDPVAAFAFETAGNAVSFTNNSVNGVNYVWDFGDGSTSEVQNPEHEFVGAGPFTVTLTATNCDKASTSTQIISFLNTKTFGHQQATAYPNPATKVWNINTTQKIDRIIVVDMMGKTVMNLYPESETATLDASNFSAGIYMAKVIAGDGIQTLKLVKN